MTMATATSRWAVARLGTKNYITWDLSLNSTEQKKTRKNEVHKRVR
jgi:hypothetical protein